MSRPQRPKRIVLTGGPGAGKTVVTARLAREFPDRFALVPEAATQVYDALRTRWDRLDMDGRREVQRRIYHHQVGQEERVARENAGKVLLLDRGTIDGAAYWPEGPEDYWRDLGTTPDEQLARYDAVIWMETCATLGVYDGDASNACRFEDAKGAVENGRQLLRLWEAHPNLRHVSAYVALEDKIRAVRDLLRSLPTPQNLNI